MKLDRRTTGVFLMGMVAAPFKVFAAWPDRQLKIVVPYPAGGNADNTARLISIPLGERLKTQVLIDNRPGGAGTIGAATVAKAAPDGYTLLLDATAFTVNPSLIAKLPYDAAKDFEPVSLLMRVPLLLVVPANSPHRTLTDLLSAARANPGKLSYASAGNGGAQHLAAELLKQSSKVFITHVPYRGGAPALTDLVGGQVDMMFSAVTACAPFVASGKLRVLAITSAQKAAGYPQIPTVAESGFPGFQVNEWNGLWAPAGTSRTILDYLEAEIRAVMATPELRQRLEAQGVQPVGSNSAEFAKFLRSETEKWAQVLKTSGIKAD